MTFLHRLFSAEFLPHGHCYYWRPDILWLHTASDLLIGLSYYSIPVGLAYFVIHRRHLPFYWIFWLFGSFIFLCGTTHFVAVYTTWRGVYGLEGFVKAATALVSAGTAIFLWRLIPQALALPSPAEFDENHKALRELNATLERRVAERTEELLQKNQELEYFNQFAVGREEQMIALKREINQLCERLNGPPRYDLSFDSNKKEVGPS